MGKFVIKTSDTGCHFVLKADNGEVIAFTAGEVVDRVEQFGDLFAPVVGDGAALPDLGLT